MGRGGRCGGRPVRLGLFAVTLLLALPVSAEPNTNESPPQRSGAELAAVSEVDCETAVNLVLADHPSVRAVESRVDEARASSAIVRWLERPEVRVRTDADTRANDDVRLGVRLPLENPWAVAAREREAAERVLQRSAELDEVKAGLAAAVRTDYAGLRRARAARAIRDRLAERAREYLAAMEGLTKAGSATVLDRENAALVAAETEEEATRGREREDLARVAVARWNGGAPAGGGATCAVVPDIVLEEAVANHASVRAAAARAAAAEAEASAVAAEQWLWPSFVEATWVREAQESDGVLVEAGVRLPVPDRRVAGEKARARRFADERDATAAAVRVAIERAVAEERASRERVARLEGAGERLTSARSWAERGAAAGAAAEDLWDLERRIADWEQRLIEARYEAELRQIELRREMGLP